MKTEMQIIREACEKIPSTTMKTAFEEGRCTNYNTDSSIEEAVTTVLGGSPVSFTMKAKRVCEEMLKNPALAEATEFLTSCTEMDTIDEATAKKIEALYDIAN